MMRLARENLFSGSQGISGALSPQPYRSPSFNKIQEQEDLVARTRYLTLDTSFHNLERNSCGE